ncbi:hypothetical protein CHU94_00030 [Rhodoferax sp. TH121]|nr:hypothetical protein CHU94_00030 [Rhodoferax sp. TH121]
MLLPITTVHAAVILLQGLVLRGLPRSTGRFLKIVQILIQKFYEQVQKQINSYKHDALTLQI